MANDYGFWSRAAMRLIWAYRGRPPQAGTIVYYSTSEAYTSWLILRGVSRLVVNGQSITARAGQWVMLPPGSGSHRHSGELLSVRFTAQWPDGDAVFHLIRPVLLRRGAAPELTAAAMALCDAVEVQFGRGFQMLARQPQPLPAEGFLDLQVRLAGFVRQWYGSVRDAVSLTPPNGGDTRLQRIDRAVHNWPLDRLPNRTALAEMVGLSVSQMNRLYRARYRSTPMQVLDRRRADWAMMQLADPDVPIKQIRLALGYRLPPQFTAWFRRHTGSSPLAHRTGVR